MYAFTRRSALVSGLAALPLAATDALAAEPDDEEIAANIQVVKEYVLVIEVWADYPRIREFVSARYAPSDPSDDPGINGLIDRLNSRRDALLGVVESYGFKHQSALGAGNGVALLTEFRGISLGGPLVRVPVVFWATLEERRITGVIRACNDMEIQAQARGERPWGEEPDVLALPLRQREPFQ